MKTFHIEAEEGQIAKTVLMPGDPMRAKYNCRTLSDRCDLLQPGAWDERIYRLLQWKESFSTGKRNGYPVYGHLSYELFNTFGVDQIIRVGTCGAVNRDVEVGA